MIDERDEQPNLFDALLGKSLADAAIERVDEHANEEWKSAALDAVSLCASAYSLFTTDQVYEVLVRYDVETHERRAMGAIMRRAKTAGWIAPTDDYWPTARPEAHRNPKRVWRSLIQETF